MPHNYTTAGSFLQVLPARNCGLCRNCRARHFYTTVAMEFYFLDPAGTPGSQQAFSDGCCNIVGMAAIVVAGAANRLDLERFTVIAVVVDESRAPAVHAQLCPWMWQLSHSDGVTNHPDRRHLADLDLRQLDCFTATNTGVRLASRIPATVPTL